MSLKHSALIHNIRGLSSSEAFVLSRIADRADDAGENSFPGDARLAYECRLDVRTIRYIIANLIDLKLIERCNTGHTGRGIRKGYRLTFDDALTYGLQREIPEGKKHQTPAARPRRRAADKPETAETATTGQQHGRAEKPIVGSSAPKTGDIDYVALAEERARLLNQYERAQRALNNPVHRSDSAYLDLWRYKASEATSRLQQIEPLLTEAIGV